VRVPELVGETQLAIEGLLVGWQHVRLTPAARSPHVVASLRSLRVSNGCDHSVRVCLAVEANKAGSSLWATPLSMTFGTGGNAHERAHSRPMEVILTIIWLASVTGIFVLIGIIGSHAERAMTPGASAQIISFSVWRASPVAGSLGHTDTRMVEKHYGHLAPSHAAAAIRGNCQHLELRRGARITNTCAASYMTPAISARLD